MLFAESGHGQHIVEELAKQLAHQLEDEGRTTWFDIVLWQRAELAVGEVSSTGKLGGMVRTTQFR